MLTAEQAVDGHATEQILAAEQMLDSLPTGCKLRPDRACDSTAIRIPIAKQKAQAVIASMPQRNPIIPHDPEV
jgi:hypothetical protein